MKSYDKKRIVVTVMGQAGYGKTQYVRGLIGSSDRLVVSDYNAEYEELTQMSLSTAMRHCQSKNSFRVSVCDSPERLKILPRLVWAVGSCVYVIEEIDMLCRGQMLPEDLNSLVQIGRHRSVSMIGVSRNPAAIPKQFLSQSDVRVSFRQTEPRHLKALSEYGFSPDRISQFNVGEKEIVGSTDKIKEFFSHE